MQCCSFFVRDCRWKCLKEHVYLSTECRIRHAAGDEAIIAVSAQLRAAAPDGAKAVRIGGDEFLIFAAVDKDSTEPDLFGEKVDSGLKAYNESHSNPYTIGASYGWVCLPAEDDMTGLDKYIEMADAKMYRMRIERDEHRREPS